MMYSLHMKTDVPVVEYNYVASIRQYYAGWHGISRHMPFQPVIGTFFIFFKYPCRSVSISSMASLLSLESTASFNMVSNALISSQSSLTDIDRFINVLIDWLISCLVDNKLSDWSIHSSIHPSLQPFIHLFIRLFIHLFIHSTFVCQAVHSFICSVVRSFYFYAVLNLTGRNETTQYRWSSSSFSVLSSCLESPTRETTRSFS